MIDIHRLSIDEVKKHKKDIIQLIYETIIFNFPNSLITKDYYMDTVDNLLSHMNNGNAVVFAAFESEMMVGWLWCHSIDRFDSKRLHIANFAVKSESRKSGVGNKLFAIAEEYGHEQRYDGIDLFVTKENKLAVDFYLNHGFEVERYLMKKGNKKNDSKDS